jgi:SRSO17 transposase
VSYHRLHYFLTQAPWKAQQVNERRLKVMNQCSQTRITRGFTLIVDDSGHRKSGNFTAGVGRQYIGEIGKTDNGIVLVTTHLYDGKKSLPLDIELYQHASSLALGKKDIEFKKKPELGLELIDRSLERGYRQDILLIDAGYGNNKTFLLELEKRKLKYLGGVAKNRKVFTKLQGNQLQEIRLDQLAESLPEEAFTPIQLNLEQPKTLWVAPREVKISQFEGTRTIAIVMNADTFNCASEIDYLMTNVDSTIATAEWIVTTYA